MKIREIRVEDLIFIDESGVNLAMVRLYARGEHPILANPSSKLTRILGFQSIIESVMGKNGMLPARALKGKPSIILQKTFARVLMAKAAVFT